MATRRSLSSQVFEDWEKDWSLKSRFLQEGEAVPLGAQLVAQDSSQCRPADQEFQVNAHDQAGGMRVSQGLSEITDLGSP